MNKVEKRKNFIFWPFVFAFFLVFFLLVFLRKKTVKNIVFDLNSRQEKILEILSSKGEITVDELMGEIKGVSERTLRRDMGKLEELGFSKKQGNTKGSKYIYTKK